MSNVIVAFPKAEVAKNMKKVLSQSGYHVTAVCTTGAQALSSINEMETGIIVCGYRFVDMMYSEIYEYLPEGFQMLLIASAASVMQKEIAHLVCLSTPLKVHELLQTMEMMEYSITRYKKKQRQKPRARSEQDRLIIERAKMLLMDRNGMTEEEAHRYIQKRSMDNGTGLVEISQMILSLMQGPQS